MRVICYAIMMTILCAGMAMAQEKNVPATASASETVINIAPDTPEVVKLSEDAASVIVGNPKYASVTMDSPRVLLIIPRAEGATSLTVLNKTGEIVMERRLIIGGAASGDDYVRIRRACTPSMAGCVPSSTYYCPDGCNEISLGGGQSDAVAGAAPTETTAIIPLTTPPAIPPIDPAELETPQ